MGLLLLGVHAAVPYWLSRIFRLFPNCVHHLFWAYANGRGI